MSLPAVFLDRDGTIIEDRGYICDFSEVKIFPFALDAVRQLNRLRLKVVVVTNQASVARGICNEKQVRELHSQLGEYFKKKGALLDAFYFCPYHVEGVVPEFARWSSWRKPAPGMLVQAAEDLGLSLGDSYMVGDKQSDVEAGLNAGCTPLLVKTGFGIEAEQAWRESGNNRLNIFENLLQAVEFIVARESV